MDIGKKLLSLILFIIVCFVILNQLVKLSVFAYKYYNNYIIANVNKMSCGNYYAESENSRYHISKNIYDMHIDNDIFNSKTYILIIFIFSIIFFIYAFSLLASALDDNDYKDGQINKIYNSYIVLGLLALSSLVYFITIIAVRFDKGGNIGYDKLFDDGNGKYNGDVVFYTLIAVILAIKIGLIIFEIIYHNMNDDINTNKIIYLLYVSGFYVFVVYFMNNLLNIVLTFKNNEFPLKDDEYNNIDELNIFYNNEKFHNNIDISYGNENYFYRKYLEYANTPYFDIFQDIHDINKMKYNKTTSYNISNEDANVVYTTNIRNFILVLIVLITCAVLLLGLIAGFAYLIKVFSLGIPFDFDIKNNGTLIANDILLPLFIMFIIIFVIVATMEYNTFINKDILININRKYKEDLNNLNNSILPVLYLKDIERIPKEDTVKYSYVIYNVMSSYLLNTINLFNLKQNKENTLSNYDDISTIYNMNNTNIEFNKNPIYDKAFLNIHINDVNYYTTPVENDAIGSIKKYIDNIFKNSANGAKYLKNNNNTINDDIKNNIKNNIMCSMYNIDNIDNFNKDEILNSYIFKKKQGESKDTNFHDFLLKNNLDNSSISRNDANKYKIYDDYINDIVDNYLLNLQILYNRIPQYYSTKNTKEKEALKITILQAFSYLKDNLNISLNGMINDFTSSYDNSQNSLFSIIEENYKRLNNQENIITTAYYDDKAILDKFTLISDITQKNPIFNNKLKNEIKKTDIDLLKEHKDIVKNAYYIVNERLYVLISTYMISLFIAYKLVKN